MSSTTHFEKNLAPPDDVLDKLKAFDATVATVSGTTRGSN